MKDKGKKKAPKVETEFVGRLPDSGVKRDWETDPDRAGGWPPAEKPKSKER